MAQILTKSGEIIDTAEASDDPYVQFLIDIGGRIVSSQGNIEFWFGMPAEDFNGFSLSEICHPDSQVLVSEILYKAAMQEHMEELILLLVAKRDVLGCRILGNPFPRDPRYYHLEVTIDPALKRAANAPDSKDGLVDNVIRAIEGNEGEDLGMTFVSVGDVQGLTDELGISQIELDTFREQVSSRLIQASITDEVSEVDPGKYGLVHETVEDIGSLTSDLRSYIGDVDPLERVLSLGTATVPLSADRLDETEIRSAISHAVDEFIEAGLEAVIFGTLDDSHAAWIDKQANRKELLADALKKKALTVAYRVVVDPMAWEAEHLLAEFRVDLEDDGLGAAEIIALTRDDPTLRKQVDLEQCLDIAKRTDLGAVAVAMQIGIRSLLDPKLLRALLDIAQSGLDRTVILRIEGLTPDLIPRIPALQTLRRSGFKLALYSSEIGAITAERLGNLPADYLLLDPALVRDPVMLRRSIPSLNGLSGRCARAGIKVIFNGVTDGETVKLLTGVTGALTEGPHYGEPIPGPEAAAMPVRGFA
jgi:EAL domain-containing protein (putative c-di-GMP-specific phosphodiesterase class I)